MIGIPDSRVTEQSRNAAVIRFAVDPVTLGCAEFRKDHGTRYAYVAGSMYKAVSSVELVKHMGKAQLLAFYGTGGVRLETIEAAIDEIQASLGSLPYGLNLLASLDTPHREEQTVELFLTRRVRRVEAASFIQATPSLVRYRVTGVHKKPDGLVEVPNKVLAKASRPEVATVFLSPPPDHILAGLLDTGRITVEEAELARRIPMADDLCAEADSGGHTDQRPLVTLLPDMLRLRDRMMRELGYHRKIRVGAAGGLGTPESVAAAFIMNADFVLTGSINQCTVEAGTSDEVKDMLAQAGVQDTAIVPAGDMLEIGAKTQVLRKGLFFPARANKLYELYRRHNSLDEIEPTTAERIQQKYFCRTFAEIWTETKDYYQRTNPAEIEKAEQDPKHKMALTFKWYFVHSARLAMAGSKEQRVDYQIACGPAIGALNNFLRTTPREDWRARHVDELAELLMTGAAELLGQRLGALVGATAGYVEHGATQR